MTRRALIIVCCLAAGAAAAFTAAWQMPSVYRDARMGQMRTVTNANMVQLFVSLPIGVHREITVVAWLRVRQDSPARRLLTTYAFWCPDEIQRSNPDLLNGVGGYGSIGTNLTAAGGSVTIASFPFAGYDIDAVASRWPRGVYTIAGESDHQITVSLGGEDITVGPGVFTRNAVPGPSDSVVISGSGVAEVGISRTPCHRFYSEIDGVQDRESLVFTPDSIVTNELALCTWRFRCAGGVQIYQSNLGRIGAFNDQSIVKTNGPCAGYASTGHYEVGLMGLAEGPYEFDVFDGRVFTWWLSDDEMDRVHMNAVQEIVRRGIPQWR